MAMPQPKADYSLYLVTDSTPALLGSKDLVDIVDAALQGGVTIVQYRDKFSDTASLVANARRIHAVTKKYGVPLLINDRVDVAQAVGCEGVHIGQDDLDLSTARKLLGDSAIIGVTVQSVEEALVACRGGANYLGIGTMFATNTKTNTKDIIGTAGTQKILEAIQDEGKHVQTVSIGGINASNVQRVLYQSSSPDKSLDGVAVVSAIIAAADPKAAAAELLDLIRSPAPFVARYLALDEPTPTRTADWLLQQVPDVIRAVGRETPLSHNMTNLVVQNIAANVALGIGGSPIMANYGEEAADLCKLGGSLVINMGSVNSDGIQNYCKAIAAYNLHGGPIVLDPVGAGATTIRRAAVQTLLAAGYFSVIKGNEGELAAVSGSLRQQRGVDSGVSSTPDSEKIRLVRELATRQKTVVLMTGATDFVSDGTHTFAISNGHPYLGRITGSGCVLGTAISCTLAVRREDPLLAAVAAMLHYEIAAELAAAREDVKGPGTFVPALIDELHDIQKRTTAGDFSWLERAKVHGC